MNDFAAMNTTMPLYSALAPNKQHAVVYERTFTNDQLTVQLRPLWVPHDLPEINNWLFDEFAMGIVPVNRLPVNELEETFSAMLQCTFAQPFMGTLNGNAGFMIEICEGDKHYDGPDDGPHAYEPGDHMIRLLLSPPMISMRLFADYTLLSSMDHFFSYLQVKRIVWELTDKDKHYINLANRLRFEEHRLHDWPGVHLYLYSRENFFRFLHTYKH